MSNLNEFGKRPNEANENLSKKKGINLFFGEAEARFLDQVGKELTVDILQESFILYRVDLKKTRSHKLYGESKKKAWKEEVEVFGRINVEVNEPSKRNTAGPYKKAFGNLTAAVHISHLEEVGLVEKEGGDITVDIHPGDFIAHKGQFYEIYDDGFAQISNQHSYAGDRRFSLTIKAKEVDGDVFKAR